MPEIKAIVFDMDGVLVDAKDWHYEALNRALNLYGKNISREEHLSVYDGLPTKKKLEMLSERHGFDIPLHQVINDLKQMYTLDLVEVYCEPSTGHIEALSRLKEEGYRLGVASNSVRNSVETMMKRCELSEYLDVMLSNEDVKNAKPAPDIYLKAAEKLGVLPGECLVLEDNKNGIEAARAAGCHVLVVATTADVNYQNIKNELNRITKAVA